jgi:hypothetical protein
MTRKHFVLLADMIYDNNINPNNPQFLAHHIYKVMHLCKQANPKFNAARFLARVNNGDR